MKIIVLPVGQLQANCYLIYDDHTKEALVIDPGAEGKKIQDEIEKLRLQVKYIVNTHGHLDHIAANQDLKTNNKKACLAIHEADREMLTDPQKNISAYFGKKEITSPAADRLLTDGDLLKIGNLSFQVLHTPGHTPGGICLWGQGACFSGDTLFAGSIGRTDLPGGSPTELSKAIQTKLFSLDGETIVYPGHGPQTSIGFEKKHNPFLTY